MLIRRRQLVVWRICRNVVAGSPVILECKLGDCCHLDSIFFMRRLRILFHMQRVERGEDNLHHGLTFD